MKKYMILIFIFSFFMPFLTVDAATGLIDIYASNKSLAPGNTFTVTVYCKSSSTIGTCEYTLSYDSNIVKFISANDTVNCNGTYCNYYVGSTNSSKTFTFKAIANGTSTISAKSVDMIGMDEVSMSTSVSPVKVSVTTPKPAAPVVYSTNNYLSSLAIDGYTLAQTFNKEVNEYTISLDSSVEEINIIAKQEDKKARISGDGKHKVSEGDNKFSIVVTSEKGTQRTYTINVKVEDKNPINVEINNNKYTVVKKKSILTKPENYQEKELTITDQVIPGFYSEITNYTLIGLKDEEGQINLYIYDDNLNTYSLYKEYQFNNLKINPINTNEKKANYIKTTIKINEESVDAYKINADSKYSLIYGMNLETGEKSWYKYEETENTIQKYENEEVNVVNQKLEKAKDLIYILGFVSIGLCFMLVVVAAIKTKNKKIKKVKEKDKINIIDDKEETKEIVVKIPKN